MDTRSCLRLSKVVKTKNWEKIILAENGLFSVRMFEILKALTNSSQRISLCNKNFASVIHNLPSFSAPIFRFEPFHTNTLL